MKMGVRKGMIRSVEECEAGINTIKRQYLNISLYNSTGTGCIIYCVIVVFTLCKQSVRPVYTGDCCRATRCNFCRAKIASSFKHVRTPCDIAATNHTKNRTWFTRAI